jgi:hypothetical protein
MSLNVEQARREICSCRDCGKGATVVLKIRTDEGSSYDCFCWEHLDVGAKILLEVQRVMLEEKK